MNALFTTAMQLREVGPGVFAGELDKRWTIGPKVHGGAMLALCANAARTACGGEQPTGPGSAQQPVAVSASFLWAPDPGHLQLVTSIRKRGRRISVVDVELTQGDRTAVHAVVNLGAPEHYSRDDAGREAARAGAGSLIRPPDGLAGPLLSANPVVDLMAPEPPDGIEPIGPGHPLAGLVHLGEGCDVRPVLSTMRPRLDGRPPVIQMWARPRGVAPDALFALMCGDLSAPVTFAVDRTGWAPTIQLTAFLRGLPADGWLRIIATCTPRSGTTGSTRTTPWSTASGAWWCSPANWHWSLPSAEARCLGCFPAWQESRSSVAAASGRHCCRVCCARAGRSKTWWWWNGFPSAPSIWPTPIRC